jgi:hypothetical protein
LIIIPMWPKHSISFARASLAISEYRGVKTLHYFPDTVYRGLWHSCLPLTKLYISVCEDVCLNTLSYLLSIMCCPSATFTDFKNIVKPYRLLPVEDLPRK